MRRRTNPVRLCCGTRRERNNPHAPTCEHQAAWRENRKARDASCASRRRGARADGRASAQEERRANARMWADIYDDLPDGAFFAALEEQGVDPADLE